VSYSLENEKKKCVIGMAIRTSNENFHKEAPILWERFHKAASSAKIANRLNDAILAVYSEYDGDYTLPFTYLIGYEVENLHAIAEGMKGIEVSEASYAVFTASGPFPESMAKAWNRIWNADLKRLYTVDFEIYTSDFNPFNPQHHPEVKIYIAVE
jgi:predicted transcriptional regulator YdeE